MARFSTVVESAAALGANTNFANLVAGASVGVKGCRRVTLGCRAGAAVPTSQQVTVAIFRATARGTATTTLTPGKLDPNSGAAGITGVDSAWSVQPTLAATALFEVSFNTQSGADLPWELLEELAIAAGTANGLYFQNIANALPASHLLTLTIEHEE